MGTYNGECFLEEQIRSIQTQTFANWQMLIRDDGSWDNTVNILNTFQENDNRIKLIEDDKGNQGPSNNYNILCAEATNLGADIIFFSDQDDVWLPNKLETQVQAVHNLEKRHSNELPILVYTDLAVVDMQLKSINNSFLSFQGIKNVTSEPLRILLAQNYIPACASAINHSLLALALPIPDNVLMHDWWIALCAASCGRIEFIPQAMGLYRQHHSNAVGARGIVDMINPLHGNLRTRWQTGQDNLVRSTGQAQLLQRRIQAHTPMRLHPGALSRINAYANCLNLGRIGRVSLMLKNGIKRQGLFYGTLFYLLLFIQKRRCR